MKYIEGLMDDYTMDRDSAVTLGKFDGLHLGHQQLIRRICEKEKEGLESVVVTIWPNPKNPALWGIRNEDKVNWTYQKADGTQIPVAPGKTAGIAKDVKILFPESTGEFK